VGRRSRSPSRPDYEAVAAELAEEREALLQRVFALEKENEALHERFQLQSYAQQYPLNTLGATRSLASQLAPLAASRKSSPLAAASRSKSSPSTERRVDRRSASPSEARRWIVADGLGAAKDFRTDSLDGQSDY
jgi:hypothetical protein